MSNKTNPLLNWLKTFQSEWLPENLTTDTTLLESIQTKLHEFEQIIIENTTEDDDEEYHRARLLNDDSSSNSDNEQNALASTSIELNTHLPSKNDNEEIRARELLLEESDSSEHEADHQETNILRPTIRLKRISEADAERYKPLAWRTEEEEEQVEEEVKASLSEISSTSTTSDDDEEDYYIKYRTRAHLPNKTEKSPKKSSKSLKTSRKKTNDVIINYNQSIGEEEPTTVDEDTSPMDDAPPARKSNENHNKNDSSTHESLDITLDKPVEMTVDHPNEDILNEEMIEEPIDDSSDEQLPNEVVSYAHLLNNSKNTSSSDSEETSNKKRLLSSSPNSQEISRKKKSKTPIKKRAPFVLSSSSDDDNENNSTLTSNCIQIQHSSSSSDDDRFDRSKLRRTKSSISPEHLNALKQIKRKTLEKRNSNASSSSDDNESETKRSKTTDNDDEIEEISPSKGRKNIRKILDDNRLDAQTKKAIDAERERRKRLAENQEKYNNTLLEQSSQLSTTSTDQSSQITARLILELDKNTNEPLIEVALKLVEKLKPHQYEGVKFLWNNVFESTETIQKKKNAGNGCILAHCMGLGKTLQVISFLHTVFNYSKLTKMKTCLVLCPLNTALNWSNEFDYWLNGIEPSIDCYQLQTIRAKLRINHLNFWYENGGVAIMGYDLYKRLANGNGIQNRNAKAQAYKCLVDPGPDIIVADEGHILKNAQTALAKCLANIKTPRRIVLTGTPLQNNLIEYYCMVSFIKPNLLGSQSEYINRFVNPIQNGQHRDSNEEDVRLMKRRACVLHELLSGFIDRKDYSLLKKYLPPKFEYIINIRLSDLQSKLYEIYLEKLVDKEQRLSVTKNDFKSAKLFADYQYLQKIWTHPFLLYPYFIKHWKERLNKDDLSSIDDHELELFLDDDDDDEETINRKKKKKQTDEPIPKSNYAGFLIDNIKDENIEPPPSNSSTTTTIESDSNDEIEIIRTYPTRSRTTTTEPIEEESNDNEPWLNDMSEQFWFPFLDMLPKGSEFDFELSGKFLLLKAILDKCADIGDKIILFSRSLYTLNHIESFLHHLQTSISLQQWVHGIDYFRMDGQTDILTRKRFAKTFNDLSNTRARLFLISTLAGGIGINLIGSNRVIIFDASWNPSHDTQAIFRSYRFGQKKPVYIYRLLAHGTMEEKIYQRQVVKQSISQRVVDDHQLDRHFTQNDIKELYKFKAESLPDEDAPLDLNISLPKDRLLLELIYEHGRWIHSYHSHDSLLENKIDESLTAEERRRALEEYENLKRLPDPRHMILKNFQEQQERLNQNIALQHQRASIARLQQTYPQLQQTLANPNGHNLDFSHILQHLQTLGIMPRPPNTNNRPTTALNPPIQPRPVTTNANTNSKTNDVIVIEGDEEPSDRPTS